MLKSDISSCQHSAKALVVPERQDCFILSLSFSCFYMLLSLRTVIYHGPCWGKSTTKHKLRDGEWFIASSAALLFPRRSWTQKNSPLCCCRARFRTPAGPQRDSIGWGFWVFYSCLIEKPTTSLDDKHSLNSENTPRSYTRHYWSNIWSNIYLSYFSDSMLLLIAFYHSFPTVSMLSFSILS